MPDFVKVSHDAANKTVSLAVEDANQKKQNEMWGASQYPQGAVPKLEDLYLFTDPQKSLGTSWAYLNNYVMGVSEGHTAILRLVGVGYRATVEQRAGKEQYPGQPFLCLKLGFTHPVEEGVPKGVKVSTPTPTRILLEGTDREAMMSFAGKVRLWRPPEPYKGKGIFINDQTIKLKGKKIS